MWLLLLCRLWVFIASIAGVIGVDGIAGFAANLCVYILAPLLLPWLS
jgi:hypothetical protein